MEKFVGRHEELKILAGLKSKKAASLIVCKGRRRIGKSTLIREFGRSFTHYLEFQGLPPAKDQTNQDQIDNFTLNLSKQSGIPRIRAENWSEAFESLITIVKKKPTLILLDEISWMGKHDLNFPGRLKIFWDTYQQKYNQLILCLCGSVSTWIEENILNSTHFVGRISQTITLKELSLQESNGFFPQRGVTSWEKLQFLSVVGGVPKYLEELRLSATFNEEINRTAFTKGGFLFEEFSKLFNNSFETEKQIYVDILQVLAERSTSLDDIIKKLGKTPSGNYITYLSHLEQAGLVARDPIWKLTGTLAKASRYRIADNYTRFYLSCVEPSKAKIQRGITKQITLESIANWRSILA